MMSPPGQEVLAAGKVGLEVEVDMLVDETWCGTMTMDKGDDDKERR
jgi:hypothetical protein